MGKGRKRRIGDRSDGRRLRTLDPYNAMIPFIMRSRSDSSNYFTDSVEITEAERFLRNKRLHGFPGMGLLHLFVAAYLRTAAMNPAINRFISGQRIFARNNFEFIMTIKKEMRADAPETSIKVILDLSDTINDVYYKLNAEINNVKNKGEETGTDNLANFFIKMPRLILKFVVRLLETLDYFGKMPRAILKASPFHGTITITDLGSIGLPALYHHLYNFGNVPVFMALGAKRRTRELRPDGTVAERKYVDYKAVIDERCCDGFLFSQAFKMFRSLLREPQILDEQPETVVEDID